MISLRALFFILVFSLTTLTVTARADSHCNCKIIKSDCGDCNTNCTVQDLGAIADYPIWDFSRDSECQKSCAADLEAMNDFAVCTAMAANLKVPLPWNGEVHSCGTVGTQSGKVESRHIVNCVAGDNGTTAKKYWKLTFSDEFKGKPDNSADNNYCYDQLKPQCQIWSSGASWDCDDLSSATANMSPVQANWTAAIKTQEPSWQGSTLNETQAEYSRLLTENLKDLNKCTWTMYEMVNWMATDYSGHWAAKMDPTQAKVHPEGKGYLELTASAAPSSANCVWGGSPSGPGNINCGVISLPANIVIPGVNYWVDPDIRWPGIYYATIGGKCPYGGLLGVNCQVMAFDPLVIEAGMQYWVDTNPSWPGVYYKNTPYRCKDNMIFPPQGGFYVKQLSCPILDGAMLSNNFDPIAPSSRKRGFVQKYGRFEVKLKIPKGKGAFPAAWLMPNAGGWPFDGGEIDLMEARDAANETYQTYHHGKCIKNDLTGEATTYIDDNSVRQPINSGVCQNSGKNYNFTNYFTARASVGTTVSEKTTNEFFERDHVFAAEWTENQIDFFVNNIRTNNIHPGTVPKYDFDSGHGPGYVPGNLAALETTNFPANPFYWILNHSTYVAPADQAGFQKQSLMIDYVKTYAQCTTPADFCPCGGTFTDGVGCTLAPGRAMSCPGNLPNNYAATAKKSLSRSPASSQTTYPSPCQESNEDCIAGGTKAGPNCSVYAFEQPQLAPGVSYWVDTNPAYPGVYYHKVNGGCPYGGSGSVNCQMYSFASDKLNRNTSYWVDTDPRWPGVFYHKVNGGCPYGGSGSVNCQYKSFKSADHYVIPSVSYWVDSNPAFPGVYYHKINGGCPYGGSVGVNCQLIAFPADTLEQGVSYWVDSNPLYPGVYYKPDFR